MSAPTPEARQLGRIRCAKLALTILFVGYLPIMAAAMAVLELSDRALGVHLSSRFLDILGVPWVIAVPVLAVWIGLQRCPRCGCLFSVRSWWRANPLRFKCAHCGVSARRGAVKGAEE